MTGRHHKSTTEEDRQEQRKEFLDLYAWLRNNKAQAAAYGQLRQDIEAIRETHRHGYPVEALNAALRRADERVKRVLADTPEKP